MSAHVVAPDWLWDGEQPRIGSVFQPIVDIWEGRTLGYEVLSRGLGALREPLRLFERAREEGRLWELERACLTAAIRSIAALPGQEPETRFFLNLSPAVLRDERFGEHTLPALLQRHGLRPERVVLEVTETSTEDEDHELQARIRRHAELGFGIALDDFGAGHSNLVRLVHLTPHFIKLDRALVKNLHQSTYGQKLVGSLVSFAASVEARLIAEGVETWEELTMLLRLGVRYAQGYLMARPASEPPQPSAELEQRLLELVHATRPSEAASGEKVDSPTARTG